MGHSSETLNLQMISTFIDEAVTLNNLPASPAICWHWTLYQNHHVRGLRLMKRED